MVIADIDRRLTVAYIMNKLAPDVMIVGPIAAALVERCTTSSIVKLTRCAKAAFGPKTAEYLHDGRGKRQRKTKCLHSISGEPYRRGRLDG